MTAELVLVGYLIGLGAGYLLIRGRVREHRTAYDNPELQRTSSGWVRLQ